MASHNPWNERKIHIARGNTHKTLCGSSSNRVPEVRVAYGSVPPGVTCERCIKLFRKPA